MRPDKQVKLVDRFLILGAAGLLAFLLAGCSNPSPTAPTPGPDQVTMPPPEPQPDPLPLPEPQPQPQPDDSLHWDRVATSCQANVRSGHRFDPTRTETRLDRLKDGGTVREVILYESGPEWFIDATFVREGGQWLLCNYDTRG